MWRWKNGIDDVIVKNMELMWQLLVWTITWYLIILKNTCWIFIQWWHFKSSYLLELYIKIFMGKWCLWFALK